MCYFLQSDTGDTKDSQRKLDQALKDVQEYKQKYEKIKQVSTVWTVIQYTSSVTLSQEGH